MPKKKVGLTTKTKAEAKIDQWVNNKSDQKLTRMTIDLPEELHKKIKINCVQQGKTISEAVRSLLLKEFA
jgi:hypothetical protein